MNLLSSIILLSWALVMLVAPAALAVDLMTLSGGGDSIKQQKKRRGRRGLMNTKSRPTTPPSPPSTPSPPSPPSPPSTPSSNCKTLGITLNREDIPTYFVDAEVPGSSIRVGGLNQIPFYSTRFGTQLGTYSDSAMRYQDLSTNQTLQCTGTGAFNFEHMNKDGMSLNQINVAYTCDGVYNTITGGTGRYLCASGYIDFATSKPDVVEANLYFCQLDSCDVSSHS